MPKPLGFRDFIVVEYKPGEPDLINYRAVKRRRLGEDVAAEEGLSVAARRKKAMQMKRLAPRIKMARKRALRKSASLDTIKNRAKKQARDAMFRRLSKGKSRSEVSPQRRAEIEKRLKKMSKRIDTLAKRNIPTARKLDRERKKSKS